MRAELNDYQLYLDAAREDEESNLMCTLPAWEREGIIVDLIEAKDEVASTICTDEGIKDVLFAAHTPKDVQKKCYKWLYDMKYTDAELQITYLKRLGHWIEDPSHMDFVYFTHLLRYLNAASCLPLAISHMIVHFNGWHTSTRFGGPAKCCLFGCTPFIGPVNRFEHNAWENA